jgi:hypothetical protein
MGFARAAVVAVGLALVVGCGVSRAEPTDVSGGHTYAVAAASNDGRSSDGRGSWRVGYLTLSGGDHRVADAFNSASAASAAGQLASTTEGAADGTTPWRFESEGQVTFRPIAIAQLITGSLAYGAHPTSYIGTVVIDSRTARVITLAELFDDDAAGLARLSEQSRSLLARDGLESGSDVTGLAPTEANFANWIPTPNGLEVHFTEYQLGTRYAPTVLVPWTALTDVLAPGMDGLTT